MCQNLARQLLLAVCVLLTGVTHDDAREQGQQAGLNRLERLLVEWQRRCVSEDPSVLSIPREIEVLGQRLYREADRERIDRFIQRMRAEACAYFEVTEGNERIAAAHFVLDQLAEKHWNRMGFCEVPGDDPVLALGRGCLESGFNSHKAAVSLLGAGNRRDRRSPELEAAALSFFYPYLRPSDWSLRADSEMSMSCHEGMEDKAGVSLPGQNPLSRLCKTRDIEATEEIGDLFSKAGVIAQAMKWYLVALCDEYCTHDSRFRLLAKLSVCAERNSEKWRAIYYEWERLYLLLPPRHLAEVLRRLDLLHQMPDESPSRPGQPEPRPGLELLRQIGGLQLRLLAFPEAHETLRECAGEGEEDQRLFAVSFQQQGLFFETCLQKMGVLVYDARRRTWKDVAHDERLRLDAPRRRRTG